MEYKVFKDIVAIRLDKGDEITESVKAVAEKENIRAGYVTGIGAVDRLETGVFDLVGKKYEKYFYEGNKEINNLTGNLTEMDGKPYLHLHITCAGKNGEIVGGHLLSGRISITAEIFVQIIDGKIARVHDDALNFNRIVF